jgi:hypothetical protein
MDKIEALKREMNDCMREAHDPRAWPHHRAYAAHKAAELREELTELQSAHQQKQGDGT